MRSAACGSSGAGGRDQCVLATGFNNTAPTPVLDCGEQVVDKLIVVGDSGKDLDDERAACRHVLLLARTLKPRQRPLCQRKGFDQRSDHEAGRKSLPLPPTRRIATRSFPRAV